MFKALHRVNNMAVLGRVKWSAKPSIDLPTCDPPCGNDFAERRRLVPAMGNSDTLCCDRDGIREGRIELEIVF